jgi:uncharacterized membrane protein
MGHAAAWIWLVGGLLWAVMGVTGAWRWHTQNAVSMYWFAFGLMGTTSQGPGLRWVCWPCR